MPALWERIMEIALQRSFFYPSNEPYGATSGFYDYGPVGVLLKRRVQDLWREMFLRVPGNLEVESAIITPEIVLKASQHVDNFADNVAECKKCGKKLRADHVAEEKVKGFKWDGTPDSLKKVFADNKQLIVCTSCGGELSEPYVFNLMFKTWIGGDAAPGYSRPETAQGIFTAFLRLYKNHGTKLPMAVGQVGRSFRNEISPRNVLVRMREFTQMELEYFFNPASTDMEDFNRLKDVEVTFLPREGQSGTKREPIKKSTYGLLDSGFSQIFAYHLALEWEYYRRCGLNMDKCVFRRLLAGETPHYSKDNVDMEIETSYGVIETAGNAYRTDFDLSQHQKFSNKDFSVFIEAEKKKLVPHVFEVSLGVDRLVFCMMEHCFREKTPEKDWEWFDFPPEVAPFVAAVFPLMKKDGMAEKAKEIASSLRVDHSIYYSESGSIGRRYAKADEIGVPYSIVVDYETLEGKGVTIRYRNDGKQERVPENELGKKIMECMKAGRVSM
jgi:glycyl-tRNA synthetase